MRLTRWAGLKPRHSSCVVAVAIAAPAFAQQPPRPVETPRSVTLSLAEYNRLLDLAARPSPAIATPVGAVVSSADVNVRVDGDTARGVFNLAGDALRPGYSRVALVSGATLVDATAPGRPLPLVADGKAHAALVSGPGPFALTLQWGAPLTFAPGRASFVLPVPQAGTARATFDIPGEQADVRLSTGLITRRAVANGRTIVDATLDPGSSTDVSWSMRDSAPVAASREARTLADVLTLITIGESDVRLTTLVDLVVVQGEPRSFAVRVPAGYEFTSVTGSSLESSQVQGDSLVLAVAEPSLRSHQFLIGLERAHRGGSMQFDTGFISVRDVQRERGEVAIEGGGTIELTAAERAGMHRVDVRELNPALHALARVPVLAGFRYQRAAGEPGLALDVKRFADVGVLAAVADRAVATTLVTSEGRALTEITLDVQNRAQPFLKLTLPAGATMISAEVAGHSAKPVAGADGIRVPLLRPGFRPSGSYRVSFVYLHAGVPFAKKGELQMALPKMDIPIGIVEWELFVPEHYSARAIDGNMISAKHAPGAGLRHGTAGGLQETITVTAASPSLDRAPEPPSPNVVNLQRRTAGVLPVRVDVPRAGTSHQFIKPLVVDQEAFLTLRYKRK